MFQLPHNCTHLTHQQNNAQNSPSQASTVCELRISRYTVDLEKADQIASIHWIIEKAREFQKNIYFSFIDYVRAFGCADHNKLWKILQEMGIPDHMTCLLRNLCRSGSNGQNCTWNNRLVPNWKRSGVKAIYCHPAYLTYMQSTSCEMLGWMNHKLESRLLGEISTTSVTQMTPL